MRKALLMCFLCLTATFQILAQDRAVTGKVIDDAGAPMPGVNISVKGTTKGTTTDANGDFSINVSPDQTLLFSFVGYKIAEVVVGSRSVIDIKMTSDAQTLGEITITTAGGIKTKTKEIGTANTVVTPEILTAGRAVNIASGLQGKVAGFQISGTSSGVNPNYRLILRGQRSLTGNNQALVVLDNVIVPNSVLGNLNPNDVEQVVVLNGAGAAALYGSQASNGAVIVTTKKGAKGTTQINVSHTTSFEQVAFYPKLQTKFGAGGSAYGIDANGNPSFSYLENQSYGPAYDGVKRALGPALEDGSQDSTTYDYKKGHLDFWNKGVTNQTDFSLSSGSDNSTFYLAGQYAGVTGTTPGDKYNRTVLRLNGSRKLGKIVNVTYSSSYTQNRYDLTTATGSVYANMLNMPSNVDITRYKNWRTDKFANPNGFYNPWYQNPYFTVDNYREKTRNDYLVANLEVKVTPIEGLDIIARQGITTRNTSNKATVGAFDYTYFAEHTDASSKSDISASVTEGSNYSTMLLSDLLAQYNKKLGDVNINVIAGGQWTQNEAKYMSTTANGLVVNNLYNLSNGVGTPSVSASDYKTRQIGAYGKVTLGFKDFLFLNATGRNDWDSRLDKENRSFFYPAVDASLVLTEAIPAFDNIKSISYLKIRGGISKVGQVNLGNSTNLGAYLLEPTFSSSNSGFPYGSLAGYSVGNSLVQKGLKPEITKGYEFGFDLNMFDNRLTTNVTWYNTKTDNQTVSTSVSGTTGFTNLLTNVGQTQSKGLELTLHVTPIRTDKLTVTVGGNYTYLDNKVNFISDGLPSIILSSSGNATSSAIAGYAFPTIMGYDYVRDPQGHVIVDAVTGLPTKTSSFVNLGNATAKNRIGMDASVDYKAFRFSILFEYRSNYKIYNGIGPELDWSGTGYRTAVYDRKSFVFPNSVYLANDGSYVKNTDITIANGNGNNGFWTDDINRGVTSNYVTSANFLKLREVSIQYNLPSSILSKTKFIKGATLSIQGRNLFIWLAKDNLYTDPEYSNAGNDSNGIGINTTSQAPPSRYYGTTLSLKF